MAVTRLLVLLFIVAQVYSFPGCTRVTGDVKHILKVESLDSSKENLQFQFAFIADDRSNTPGIIFVSKVTPFEMKITAANFMAVVLDTSKVPTLKVVVRDFRDGNETGGVTGQVISCVVKGTAEGTALSNLK